MNLRVYEEYNILSLSSLPPGFSGKNKHQEIADGIKGKSAVFDNPWDLISSEPTTGERDFYYRYGRGRGRNRSTSFLTSRQPRGYSIKPLSSLESCLIAQLYKEHVEMDDYVYTPPSSPTAPTLRPLFVTDVKEIICRASSDSYRVQFGSGENKVQKGGEAYAERESVLGVPSLPEIDSVELPKKLIQKRGKGCLGRSNSSNMSVTPKNFWSQGSPNGMLLFCIGITIGVISSIMANKREVYKLNGLLKQAENLVQDLQEELEMKDSLTVKELANEGYASQQNNDFSIRHQPLGPFFPKQRFTESNNCDSEELYDKKEDEKPESMSKIEAELEAELERLELNMCSTIVQTRLSNLLEIHPDFDGDIVQGEMRAYMTNRGDRGQYDSDQDVSHTSTTPTHTANYAVLSRELSLRLHEVIQARLEERIMELETALQKSRNWAPLVESGGVKSQRDFLNCEIGPSSSYGCSTMIEDSDYIARPRVLNLSEEALDVYNEAHEELMRITEPQREPAIHSN